MCKYDAYQIASLAFLEFKSFNPFLLARSARYFVRHPTGRRATQSNDVMSAHNRGLGEDELDKKTILNTRAEVLQYNTLHKTMGWDASGS